MSIDTETAKKLGTDLVDILDLKMNKKGLVSTNWGLKTQEGLARSIINLVQSYR